MSLLCDWRPTGKFQKNLSSLFLNLSIDSWVSKYCQRENNLLLIRAHKLFSARNLIHHTSINSTETILWTEMPHVRWISVNSDIFEVYFFKQQIILSESKIFTTVFISQRLGLSKFILIWFKYFICIPLICSK